MSNVIYKKLHDIFYRNAEYLLFGPQVGLDCSFGTQGIMTIEIVWSLASFLLLVKHTWKRETFPLPLWSCNHMVINFLPVLGLDHFVLCFVQPIFMSSHSTKGWLFLLIVFYFDCVHVLVFKMIKLGISSWGKL